MRDFNDEKTRILEEEPPFSDEDAEDNSIIEEEDWEEYAPWWRSGGSLLRIGLLCVMVVVLALVFISYMKPSVEEPEFVGARMRVRIRPSGGEQGSRFSVAGTGQEKGERPLEQGISGEVQKSTGAVSSEPSIEIEQRDLDEEAVFILREKEAPKEEGAVEVSKVEERPSEIRGKEGGEQPQVAMVGEAKPSGKNEQRPPEAIYTVNIASFRTRDRAERLTKELREKELEPFIEKADIPQKGVWYRVAVGRFSSTSEALDFARGLKEKGIDYSFVRKLGESER
jgi:cell division septation protein DedD